MEQERRGSIAPLPDDITDRLNTGQIHALKQLEELGWSMKFVRRPRHQKPTYVVFNDNNQRYAVLNDDGTLNLMAGIKTRLDLLA